MLDRRTFLASSTALGFVTLAGCATTPRQSPAERDPALHQMLRAGSTRICATIRPRRPTSASTSATSPRLRAQLGDASLAEANEDRAQAVSRHRQLRAFGRDGLTTAGQLNYDIAEFRWSVAAESARFRYGNAGGGRPAPYVVSQLGGAYYNVPDFLDTQHPVRTAEDADAYLSRLDQFGRNLEQEVERIRHDASVGVIPPDFVLDKAIGNLERLRATPAAETTLVRSLVRRAGEAKLTGDYGARAGAIVSGRVARALDAEIAALRDIRRRAVHDAGCWRLPAGEAYYAWGVRANTTTTMSGDEIHPTGLAQVAQLHGQLDTLLRAQGYTQGTVGQRLNAINSEPRFLFANTDAGRAELLAFLNEELRRITPLLPRMFNTLPRASVEIRRVPPTIEAGAPGGYYQGGSLDGSRPGAYYINLKDTHEWPKLGLPTLTWHEARPRPPFPGHDRARARRPAALPPDRRLPRL